MLLFKPCLGEMVLDNNGNTYLHCAIVNKASIEIIRAIIAHIPGCKRLYDSLYCLLTSVCRP